MLPLGLHATCANCDAGNPMEQVERLLSTLPGLAVCPLCSYLHARPQPIIHRDLKVGPKVAAAAVHCML